MSPVSRDPLTPEERELASRLSRIGPHSEPPATLDARILSAAHAALVTAPPRRRRWPAVLGVAATLALAVGISWQLRPRPEAAPVLEEGPAAAPQAVAPQAEAADAAAAMPSAPPSEAEAEATADMPQPQRVPPVAVRAKAPAPQEPPIVVESAEVPVESPMELAPAMAPAPAPAPAAAPPPPRPASEATAAPMSAAAASDSAAVAGTAKAAQRSASPQPVAADRLEIGTVPRIGDRAARDVPIEEDARLTATDWLDRIRLRRAADDVEGARASLALFRRHYPDHVIPQDLAPLAQ